MAQTASPNYLLVVIYFVRVASILFPFCNKYTFITSAFSFFSNCSWASTTFKKKDLAPGEMESLRLRKKFIEDIEITDLEIAVKEM